MQSNEQYEEACVVFKLIPEGNPHVSKASDKVVHYLLKNLDPDMIETGCTELPEEVNKLDIQEKLFRYSLKAGANLQKLTDDLYHKLCGGTGLNPTISNVKGDADTLIASATMIRKLQSQLKQLITTPPANPSSAGFFNI